MALIDKYAEFNLADLLAALDGLAVGELRLVLLFAELLGQEQDKKSGG
ncbi:hypothetical protein ES703_72491 [subsurface metagenome]